MKQLPFILLIASVACTNNQLDNQIKQRYEERIDKMNGEVYTGKIHYALNKHRDQLAIVLENPMYNGGIMFVLQGEKLPHVTLNENEPVTIYFAHSGMKILYENGQGLFIGVNQSSIEAVKVDLTISKNDQVIMGYGLSRNLNGWEKQYKKVIEMNDGSAESFLGDLNAYKMNNSGNAAANCDAGGQGAVSCSVGSQASIASISGEESCSTECGDG